VSPPRASPRAEASHALGTCRSKSSGRRHRRIGFSGTLPALGSLLALRVLLDGRRPVARFYALGTNSRTSPRSWVRSTPRCHARCLGPLVLARPCAAHPNDPGPLRRTRRGRQPPPGMPTPGYHRRAQGVSPSSRLDGAIARSGLVSSRSRPWGSGPPGLSLSAGSKRLSAPAALMAFAWAASAPGRCPPGLVYEHCTRAVAGALQRRRPSASQAPSRTCRVLLARHGRSGRPLTEPVPRVPRAFITARARGDGRRTAPGSPSRPTLPAKSWCPRPAV
jgi:hypothetical protein